MKASELVEKLTQEGVQIWVDNDKLNIRSHKGVITPELQEILVSHKAEIIALVRETDITNKSVDIPLNLGLSLPTIGRLIAGFFDNSIEDYQPPIINAKIMAQKLKVTFKPLPPNYKKQEILKFCQELETTLINYGVRVLPWQEATQEFAYNISLPITHKKVTFKLRGVKAEINAVIDVENPPSCLRKLGIFVAENFYKFYSQVILKNRQIPVTKIAKLSSWAEEHTAKYVEDPTNTQVIIITDIDQEFINPAISYQQKINIGLKTLVRTFSEIVIGVSKDKISILNMNLSDSIFLKSELEEFVLKSLIPKVFVPISPLLLSRFQLGNYNPYQSIYAANLVKLGQELAETGLFPSGFKLDEVVKRKSHRDIVNVIVNGRTGVSYGFVAYAEPPQYIGAIEITANEWDNLLAIEGFSSDEIRKNQNNRRYVKIKIGDEYLFKQVPDIWLVSSRSGANKTDLNIASDIIRIGLTERLLLELPEDIQPEVVDIKPSYDIYVMLAISLGTALYTPELIKNGAPIVHFHGYPAFKWFTNHEYCVGVNNPSVPCGTYESGIFNFLGISSLAKNSRETIDLVGLIEPDHGTNFIASNMEYLIRRLKTGCAEGDIELGGKHFASLKANLSQCQVTSNRV